MADYNTLMDKVNTDTEAAAVHADCAAVSSYMLMATVVFSSVGSIQKPRKNLSYGIFSSFQFFDNFTHLAISVVHGFSLKLAHFDPCMQKQ